MDFINTQVVSIGDNNTCYIYSEANSDYTANLVNSDYWGNPKKGIVMNNNTGKINLQTSVFLHPGQTGLGNIKGGKLLLDNSYIWAGNSLFDAGSEKNVSVTSSVIDPKKNDVNSFAKWVANQSNAAEITTNSDLQNSLSRDGWSASASNNNSNAYKSLDNNANTRWDTAGSQQPNQWFLLDMGKVEKFDTVVLDLGSSTGDAPKGYQVFVSKDGNNYGQAIATGGEGNGIITFDSQEARYIKIVQTGTKTNYWSIHEIYVLNNDEGTEEPEEPVDPDGRYAGNPIITSIFTADPSAHVWGDGKLYVYASHDMDPARGCDLMDRYHVFSTEDMVTWVDEGEILNSSEVSWGREEGGFM